MKQPAAIEPAGKACYQLISAKERPHAPIQTQVRRPGERGGSLRQDNRDGIGSGRDRHPGRDLGSGPLDRRSLAAAKL
ncbi:MAG TPA: hypothetical protein PLW65_16945 [Pseudomonadota bacterium]|nr:hypothetical protein [Pseudomonadota bacterium]